MINGMTYSLVISRTLVRDEEVLSYALLHGAACISGRSASFRACDTALRATESADDEFVDLRLQDYIRHRWSHSQWLTH